MERFGDTQDSHTPLDCPIGEGHRVLEDRVLVLETNQTVIMDWMERVETKLDLHIADSRTLPGYSGNNKGSLVVSKTAIAASTTVGGGIVAGVIQALRMLGVL